MPTYKDDLSYVHHVGFGDFALRAAPGLIGSLREAGIREGLVVDLGCGSGLWARELTEAGYEALGIDSSAAMIELARAVAPRARFVQASLFDAELPRCDAVTALGEPFSYIPDGMDAPPPLADLFERVAQALRPGGLFVFDLVVRSGQRPMSHRTWSEGEDWAVLVEVAEDLPQSRLTREIITFRRLGETWRRSHETHRVATYDRAGIERELRRAGFSVRASRKYGDYELLPRRLAFRARRSQ
jgi:SAM-dependent methyltransferase